MSSEIEQGARATDEARGPASSPPPELEGPWLRQAVRYLTGAVTLGVVITLVVNIHQGMLSVAGLLAAQLVVLGVVAWLNRVGPPRRAAQVLGLSLPLLATGLLVASGNGFRGTAMLVYPACLIVAGLLLDRTTLAILAAETIAGAGFVLGGEALGMLGDRSSDAVYLPDFIDATVILSLTAVSVGLVADRMRAALQQARDNAAALTEANTRLEEQAARLNQARKMELIGRLAGGVAHDFNNLLSVMTGHLTLLRRHLPPNERTDRWLKEADGAAWRAAEITRELLSFAQQRELQMDIVDVRDVVESLAPRLKHLAGEGVSLDVCVSNAPCRARADRRQIERVVASLVTNGRDAMSHEGRMTVTVDRTEGEGTSGERVSIAVTDTGGGMSEEVRQRLFEPFFTTKLPGSTAGLSLALVYTVVEQHGGWIDVESELNEGSTITVHLPPVDTSETRDARVPVSTGVRAD